MREYPTPAESDNAIRLRRSRPLNSAGHMSNAGILFEEMPQIGRTAYD